MSIEAAMVRVHSQTDTCHGNGIERTCRSRSPRRSSSRHTEELINAALQAHQRKVDKKFDELSSEAKALAIRALQCCLGDHATAETLTPQYGIEVPSDGLVAEAEWAWNEHKKLAKETAKHKEEIATAKQHLRIIEKRLNHWLPLIAGQWEEDPISCSNLHKKGEGRAGENLAWHLYGNKRKYSQHDGPGPDEDAQCEDAAPDSASAHLVAELSALQTGLMMSEQDQIEEFEQQIDVVKEMIRQEKEKLRKRRRMSPY